MNIEEIYEKIKDKPADELIPIYQGNRDDYPEELITAIEMVLNERGIRGEREEKKSNSGGYIRGSLWASTAVIPLLIILMLFTNPGREEYIYYTKQQMVQASENNPISKGMAAIVPESIIDSGSIYRDYHLFGIYENKILGDVKVLGIFNQCILLGDRDLLFQSSSTASSLNGGITADEDSGEPDVYFLNREVAPGYDGYYVYSNSRYGFYIYYPQELNPNRMPANGDGQAFTSNDESISLTVFGSNLISEEEIKDLYVDWMDTIQGDITYTVLEDNYFILSWLEGDTIYYQKTFAGKASQNTFIFSYPGDKAEEYKEAVEILESSFTHGDLDQAH